RWDAIEAVPTIDRFSRLQFLQGFSDGSIIVSDGRKTFLRKDRAWNDISDGDRFVDRLWGSAPDNLYSVGFGSARHFDGSTWTDVALPGGPTAIYSISGRSTGEVVMSGRFGKLFNFDGSQWSVTQLDSNAVFDRLAVTESGRVFGSTYSE